MRKRLACLLAIAVTVTVAFALAGCDGRRAGTEVGNPEITVAADVRALDYTATRTLALDFRVMGMTYGIARPGGAPDSGKCWARPGGILVDFAVWGSTALPDTSIEDEGAWPRAEIILRSPEGPAWTPDIPDIGAWSNPRYAKFNLVFPGVPRTALFEMPQGAEYRLLYDSLATDSWRKDDKILIPFLFNTTHLFDPPPPISGMTTRLDGNGVQYVLFSPTENAATWNAMKARLPECFYAGSVIVK